MANQGVQQAPQGEGAKVTRRMLTRDALVASICGFVVVLMVGASYAAVPFYNWFCRTTGFNGTTQVATSAPSDAPLERTIAVSFDSNVAPLTVGAYFQKINCFCFTEQTMAPGEKREMAVVFYVNPALAKDSENDTLKTITLSYTFFPVRDATPKPVAAGEAEQRKGG